MLFPAEKWHISAGKTVLERIIYHFSALKTHITD